MIQELPTSIQKSFHTSTSHCICKIFTQGPLGKDLAMIAIGSSDKDLHKIMQGSLRRCQHNLHKIFLYRPVQDHARASDRISSGSSRHLLPRTSTRRGSRSSYITDLDYTMKLIQDTHRRTFQKAQKLCALGSQRIS